MKKIFNFKKENILAIGFLAVIITFFSNSFVSGSFFAQNWLLGAVIVLTVLWYIITDLMRHGAK